MMIGVKRTIALSVILIMIIGLIGCTSTTSTMPTDTEIQKETGSTAEKASEDINTAVEKVSEDADSANETSEDISTKANETSEDINTTTEETMEDSDVTTGGHPWINSNIKANLTEDMELSEKDDFYLSVNHDWLMSHDIPDGTPYYGVFEEVEKNIENNIIKLMNDNSVQGHEAELSQTFYHALLDWDARNKTGIEPAQRKIAAIKEISDINELTAFLCDVNKSCFVPTGTKIYNSESLNDTSKYIVYIDDISTKTILSDSDEYKNRTEIGERYYQASKELTESILIRVGFSKDEADTAFEDAIAFETELSDYIPTLMQLNSAEYFNSISNLYDMDGLKELFQTYPIEELLKSKGYGGVTQYQVPTPDYAAKLGSLYNEDNLEQIKNYMIVKYCIDTAKMLDREAFEAYNRYWCTKYGASGGMTDIYHATCMTHDYLSDAIAKAYVDYYHLEKSKERVTRLCRDIITVYEEMLQEETWLSEETKKNAIEKLKSMKVHAVYPEKWMDYDGLELTGDSLYGYFEQTEIFNRKYDASRTGQAVDNREWDFLNVDYDPLMTNAAYAPYRNSMYIFTGMAADPFYRDDMTDEELYGGLALIIGHEISHAFDPVGAEFDKDGNLKNWWTDTDKKAFDEKTEKLIKYYDNITIWTGLNASGLLDNTELIADMGSMKAILRLAKDKKNFNYENFFKSAAETWKYLVSREMNYVFATQDSHPPYYLRCNVVVQQFQEFYDTFGIEEGDGMYLAPEDRVAVW